MRINPFVVLITLVVLSACEENKKLFRIKTGKESGIGFENTITTNDTLNALSFEYIYNGSGVGTADFNNDGLMDLFFGGNQVSGKLYLNKGDIKFEDITEKAGVSTTQWITGVSVVDINKDGRQDIYLSVAGKTPGETRRNLLFIHQGNKDGIPQFIESAKSYGLDDDSYSTMSAFFDYDKDGDLDMYLVNNWLEVFNRNNLRPKRINGEAESTDKLFRNNGDNTFTDVSKEAGITIEGYGLGINICDLNKDSWPDVYVSNDFMSNDLIWINQKDGTFKNMAAEFLKHQTHNGMGVDIADFNNDELADIIVVDMLPPGHERQKMMTPGQNYDHFHMAIGMGYQPQYMRNTLQLNRGFVDNNTPAFSEIAFMAGVAKTDWSWAPLFADLDNDGFKDLFIANGYRKDVTDLDFIFFGTDSGSPFGTPDARRKKINTEFDKIADVKITNYVFKNTGTLTFEDKTRDWGIELPTYSNGAAYADLDNDGDLDLITNNIDQEVIIYENLSDRQNNKPHYITLHCSDTSTFNQKAWVYTNGKVQYQELTPYRGFQSTVSPDLHFGLGGETQVDSIIIEWPDQKVARYFKIPADTTIAFTHSQAVESHSREINVEKIVRFEKTNAITFTHRELGPSDIKNTRTLLHELSRFGPCTATGDVNNDNLDDLFIGGETGASSRLFIQREDGTFYFTKLPIDSLHDDGAALFFDADNDNDQDLYVGGSCPSSQAEAGPHHLYINDGKGNFQLSNGLIPDIKTSASCVISSDYDGDGDLDLFIGGRIKPKEYPLAPRSFVLRNDGGKFTDITSQLNKELESPGLVSSAVWADIDNDKKPDLILTGEWMPVMIFKNSGSSFTNVTSSYGLDKTNGWWNCIQAADLNKDGFVDIIAGNTGKNSYFQPTEQQPIRIIAKDFDKNGSMDPIITYYNPVEGERFVVHNRLVLIDQIPAIKKKFETFRQYAESPLEKVFTSNDLDGSFVGDANTLTSLILVNDGGLNFRQQQELPQIAQVSTINDIVVSDLNDDGNADLILVGNNYSQETLFGQYDASYGLILIGDGKLNWNIPSIEQTGFIAGSNVKFIEQVNSYRKKQFIVISNGDHVQSWVLKK